MKKENVFGILLIDEPPITPSMEDRQYIENKIRCDFDRKKEIHELIDGYDEKLILRSERYLKMGVVSEEFVEQLKKDIQ